MKRHILLSALLLAFAANATQIAPDADYTYRIERSATGHRLTATSFDGPFHYRDIPLLPHGCSGDAGMPAAASASMFVLAQQAGPYHAEFRVPMSSGGASCELVGEFDLHAQDQPTTTTAGEVDREGPGQGGNVQLAMLPDGINDLQAADPLQLGRSYLVWGDTVVLPEAHAIMRRGGVCYFPYRYVTINAGPGSAEGTSNSLRAMSVGGPLLAFDDLPALRPLSDTLVRGQIGLPPGLSTVVLEIDAPGYARESSESNNLRSLTVDVQGSCN
jgi:hypothetical protein